MSSPHSDPPGKGLKYLWLQSSEPDSNLCVAFCLHPASHQSDVPAPPGPRHPYNEWNSAVKEAPGVAAADCAGSRGPGRGSCQCVESLQKRAAWWLAPGQASHLSEDNWVFDMESRQQLENPLWHQVLSQSTSNAPNSWSQRMRDEYTKRLDTCVFQPQWPFDLVLKLKDFDPLEHN